MTLKFLRDRVRTYINEYVGSGSEAEEDDFATETDAMLDVHINAAVRYVAYVMPMRLLPTTTAKRTCTETKRNDGRIYLTMEMPEDYLKLDSISISALKRPIIAIEGKDSPTYQQQWSCVPGIGSGEYQPRAYWTDNGEVEVHSVKKLKDEQTHTAKISYVSVPKLDLAIMGYHMPDVLTDAISMRAASLYLGMTGSPSAQTASAAFAAMIQELTGAKEE